MSDPELTVETAFKPLLAQIPTTLRNRAVEFPFDEDGGSMEWRAFGASACLVAESAEKPPYLYIRRNGKSAVHTDLTPKLVAHLLAQCFAGKDWE